MLNYRDHWQDSEVEALREGVNLGLTDNQLSGRIGRTLRGISRKRRLLGIAPNYRQERYRWCDWSKEREAKLTELWAAGISIRQIAETMNVSRNAIIGKSHRLRLPRRGRPEYVTSPRKSRPPRPRHVKRKYFELPTETIASLRIGLRALESHHCRYPIDDRDDDGLILYCGNPKHGEQSWCIDHCGICFAPRRPRIAPRSQFGIFK